MNQFPIIISRKPERTKWVATPLYTCSQAHLLGVIDTVAPIVLPYNVLFPFSPVDISAARIKWAFPSCASCFVQLTTTLILLSFLFFCATKWGWSAVNHQAADFSASLYLHECHWGNENLNKNLFHRVRTFDKQIIREFIHFFELILPS